MNSNSDDNQDRQAQAAKLRLTLGMQRDGVVMMRQNLRCRHPQENAEQIGLRLTHWLSQSADLDDPRFEVRSCSPQSNNS